MFGDHSTASVSSWQIAVAPNARGSTSIPLTHVGTMTTLKQWVRVAVLGPLIMFLSACGDAAADEAAQRGFSSVEEMQVAQKAGFDSFKAYDEARQKTARGGAMRAWRTTMDSLLATAPAGLTTLFTMCTENSGESSVLDAEHACWSAFDFSYEWPWTAYGATRPQFAYKKRCEGGDAFCVLESDLEWMCKNAVGLAPEYVVQYLKERPMLNSKLDYEIKEAMAGSASEYAISAALRWKPSEEPHRRCRVSVSIKTTTGTVISLDDKGYIHQFWLHGGSVMMPEQQNDKFTLIAAAGPIPSRFGIRGKGKIRFERDADGLE
jgi:hypothetical protein